MVQIPIIDRNSPGVIRDLPAALLPNEAWSRVQNVRFANGLAERVGGRTPLGVVLDPPGDAYQIFPYKPYNLDALALFAGNNKVWIADGSNPVVNVTGATFPNAQPNDWSFTNFNGIPILNEPNHKPQALTVIPGGPLVDLPNWPATWLAKSIRSFKNVLVAMGVSKGAVPGPNLVQTSSITLPGAVPASWDSTNPATGATQNPLASNDDDDDVGIVDGRALKDIFIIYKHTTATVMSVGGPNLFRYDLTLKKGALNLNCIVQLSIKETYHVTVGIDDIYIHNGYTERSLLEDRLRKWLFDNIDIEHSYLVHLIHNSRTGEVMMLFPITGAEYCTNAWVWNYKTDSQSIIDLDNTYSIAVGPFASPANMDTWDAGDDLTWDGDDALWGDAPATALRPKWLQTSPGGLWFFDSTAPSKQTVLERLCMTTLGKDQNGLPIFNPDMKKVVTAIFPRFEGNGTITVTMGGSETINSPITWSTPKPFNITTAKRVPIFASGNVLHIRYEATDAAQWRFLGYDLELEDAGQ